MNQDTSLSTAGAAPISARRGLLLILLGATLLAGCEQIRQTTYPRDFVYLERKEIRNEMVLLSLYLREIDDILADSATVSSEQQGRIVGILAKIDASANKLGAGNVRTNHLLIDDNIDRFKAEVNIALGDARADPPNYFALGRLSGSCLGCHKYRR